MKVELNEQAGCVFIVLIIMAALTLMTIFG